MSIYEASITNPKKQLEFYKQLSEQLQQENKQLQKELEYTIGIVEHNRKISEKNKEIHQLKDNWNKLKKYIRKNIIYDDVGMKILDPSPLEDYMQKLEQRSDSNEKISKITR